MSECEAFGDDCRALTPYIGTCGYWHCSFCGKPLNHPEWMR